MIDLLDAAGARWAALVWPLFWQGTMVALVALACLPVLRRLSPALGLALVGLALLKFFIPPVVLAPVALVDRAALLLRPPSPVTDTGLIAGTLLIVHIAGAAGLLLQLARRRRHLLAQAASGSPLPADIDRDVVRDLARQLGIARLPDVRESSGVEAPLALGIRRPLILLPRRLRDVLTSDQLRVVIAHELTHHRHRDLLADALVSVACALWWFHPLVWLLAAQFRELREERCDDRVIGLGIDPFVYCRAILDVAAVNQPAPGAAMRSAAHPLGRRFARILRARRAPRILLIGGAAVVLVFATTALPHTTTRRDPGFDPRAFGSDLRSVVDVRSVVRRTVSVRVETSTPRR